MTYYSASSFHAKVHGVCNEFHGAGKLSSWRLSYFATYVYVYIYM